MAAMSRMKEFYRENIVPQLMKTFGYKNVMQVPRLEKITLNMGLGEAVQNIKILDSAVEELSLICGQKAVITKAKRSIATYKLREGMPIGVMVTLRRDRMLDFFDKLVNIALPRVRDFRGVSGKAFDGRGNYSLGIRELNISIVTTAKTDEEGKELLRLWGMPFRN
jgi:large subunit ribosomal protein L5